MQLQPIAEKILYDLQAATGKEIELMDSYDRPLAFSALRLHQQLEVWRSQGYNWRDGIILNGQENAYDVLVQHIIIQEELVGYLAVGGERQELTVLNHTIRWLVRALISQYAENPEYASPEDLRKAYFDDLLFSKQTRQEIRLKALTANVDPEESCHVCVLRLWYDYFEQLDTARYHSVLGRLQMRLDEFCQKNPRVVLLSAPERCILICDNMQLLRAGVTQIAGVVERQCDGQFRVYGGISIRSLGHYNLRMCYENAATICDRLTSDEQRILSQDECMLELLMEQMPSATKREFVTQIFGDCPEEDVEEWARIVHVLSQNNGSINRSATELFMHKNTLQYRLMRIKERIGLDARVSQDALVLQIAFIARRSINNDKLRHLDFDGE